MSKNWTPRPLVLTSEEVVSRMVDWFRQNYEDPAERTPYESAEGGYQYIWGGPDEANDVLEEAFGGKVDEALIAKAVEKIEEDGGYEWVPVSHPSDYE